MHVRPLASLFVVLALMVWGCGGENGGGGSPTAPTASQTRTIRLEAILEFGDVAVGGTGDRTLRIYNDGNSPMTVTGFTGPTGGAYGATWTDGTIAPGNSQAATIRFSPTEARTYNGTPTGKANQKTGNTH